MLQTIFPPDGAPVIRKRLQLTIPVTYLLTTRVIRRAYRHGAVIIQHGFTVVVHADPDIRNTPVSAPLLILIDRRTSERLRIIADGFLQLALPPSERTDARRV